MFGYSKIKTGLVMAIVIAGIIFAIPNFLQNTAFWKSLPQSVHAWLKPVTLGLDLQGGSYLLMEIDTKTFINEKLTNLTQPTGSELLKKRIKYENLKVEDGAMQLRIKKESDVAAAREIIRGLEKGQLNVETDGTTLSVTYTPEALAAMERNAIELSLETVRRRIDELGTKEPQIQQQGTDRIVIQLPGVSNPNEIKELLGKTAKMSFHLVDEETTPQAAQMGKLPQGSKLVSGDETGYIVIKRYEVVGGEDLDSAKGDYDNQSGTPVVAFSFNASGAKKFANATRENVGRRLAIVLDGKVISAPTINSPITGGSGVITGNFTVQSAHELALLLRSGKLPAPLIVAEERIVGPGLGEDSIKAGTNACIAGLIFVLIFMVIVYGFFGIIADITLVMNGVILLALLSVIGATLTLPGLAGIALTVAMAVDANILIFERMKEEMQAGITVPKEVIKRGFNGAFSAIFDGQLTTLFAALFLFMLGSGSVRGFGVTLGLGLATTMFCALSFNKVLLSAWVAVRKPKKIEL